MKNCMNITHIDLQHNCIREKGFEAIIPRVKVLPITLMYLQGEIR